MDNPHSQFVCLAVPSSLIDWLYYLPEMTYRLDRQCSYHEVAERKVGVGQDAHFDVGHKREVGVKRVRRMTIGIREVGMGDHRGTKRSFGIDLGRRAIEMGRIGAKGSAEVRGCHKVDLRGRQLHLISRQTPRVSWLVEARPSE